MFENEVQSTVWRHGTMRNDTGRFLILAHEKANKIKDSNTPAGPTIIVIYQCFSGIFWFG